MKKKIGFLVITAMLFACTAGIFSACSPTQVPPVKLAMPSNIVYNAETLTLSWDPVEGAQLYYVSVNVSETSNPTHRYETETASFSLRRMTPGFYWVLIAAFSEERKNDYLVYTQSDWTEAKSYPVYAEFEGAYSVLNNLHVKIDGVSNHFNGGRLVIPDFISAPSNYVPNFEYENPNDVGLNPIEQIGVNAFKGNSAITSVEIGANVWNILDGAFENCENLSTLDLSRAKNLRSIGSKAFAGTKITEIILPPSIIAIDNEAFKNTLLETVTLETGEDLTFVGADVFDGTPWLNAQTGLVMLGRVLIKYKVTEGALLDLVLSETDIKYFALKSFEGSLIKSIDLTDFTFNYLGYGVAVGNAMQPYFLYDAAHLTNVTLPANISHIRDYAFAGCSSLETIDILSTSIIDDGAFQNSGLKYLYTSGYWYPLGQDAFKDAPLETIFVGVDNLISGISRIEILAETWNLPIEMFKIFIIGP
ncbi:MAG: leucine-rich repeat domain-containing protein [Firmicutes bacterium]|nr:leucine-rich repeat domain-containing protein [Bacillota bacterium]